MNLLKRITKRSTSDSHSNEPTAKSSGDVKSDVEDSKVPKSADNIEPNNVAAEVEEKLKINETGPPKSDEKTETPSTETTSTGQPSTDVPSTEGVEKLETTNESESKKEASMDNNNEGVLDNNNKKEEETTEVVNKSEDDKPVEQKIETPKSPVEEKVEENAEEKTETVVEVEAPKDDLVPDEPTEENKTTEKANEVSSESEDEENTVNDKQVHEEDDVEETLDEDQIKESPAYIPKGGQFYMHDQRLGASASETEAEERKERQTRADTEKWSHDLFDERRQEPKTVRELENKYGYDIRSGEKSEDNITALPPQNVRRDRQNFRQNHRPQKHNRGSHRQVENNNEATGDRRNNRGHQRRNEAEDQWPALPSQEKRDQRQEKQPRSNNQDRNKSFEQKEADPWDEEPAQKTRSSTELPTKESSTNNDGWNDDPVNDVQSYQPKQDAYDSWGCENEPHTRTNTSKQQDDLWDEPESAHNRPQRSNFNHHRQQPRTFFNRSGGAADVRRNNDGQSRRSGHRDEPSGDFRNLNNAKPLSRREPRYSRQNDDQGNSNYLQNNQRYHQQPPQYRGNRPHVSHTNAIVPPPQQMTFNQQPDNQFGSMSSGGSQMSHGQVPYRQPTGVVYFDGPQQPREFVHRRDPRPLKFTAPAK
ncbi:Protein CASC3 [Aphelenchoides besseyi]|nr:Protein CASC3 [Aphelenchoides besseyi]